MNDAPLQGSQMPCYIKAFESNNLPTCNSKPLIITLIFDLLMTANGVGFVFIIFAFIRTNIKNHTVYCKIIADLSLRIPFRIYKQIEISSCIFLAYSCLYLKNSPKCQSIPEGSCIKHSLPQSFSLMGVNFTFLYLL